MHTVRPLVVTVAFVTLLLPACAKQDAPAKGAERPEPVAAPVAEAAPAVDAYALDPAWLKSFAPLPASMTSTEHPAPAAQVTLGRLLYYDKRLSKNQDLSCNSCHGLDSFGVDGQATSLGHKGQRGGRNSPTVYNAAAHIAQFWDGRAVDVEAQAKGPVLNPVEMAMPDAAAVERLLKSIPGYVTAFAAAFPEAGDAAVSFDHMATAIAAFERGLTTPSRWDRFLTGDAEALTAAEKKGFVAFVQTGCVSCHSGALIGAAMYQKVGVVKPWPNLKDGGRFDVTGQEADRGVFKVPSLRNIEKTGPYFHDGSVSDLAEAVTLMARHQLGKELDGDTTDAIVVWLKALTGTLPMAYIAAPTMPENGPETAAPDPS